MRPRWTAAAGLVPAGLLLAFGARIGTFHGFAEPWAAALVSALVLASWPLGLRMLSEDVRARGLLVSLSIAWGVVALAWVVSPVPRAGLLAVVMLPAWLCLPWALAACWRRSTARRWGSRAISAVVLGIAGWGLLGRALGLSDRVALPLGHHNLLAALLVPLLPLAILPWRRKGVDRGLAVLAGVVGVSAVLATRSLAGAAALGVLVGIVGWQGLGRYRRFVGGVALLATAVLGLIQGPRIGAVLAGVDTSVRARIAYAEAALRGFGDRPWTGWGPGSCRWTLGEHLRPIPGVHPADQVVADPHGLPWLLLYELGVVGICGLGVAVSSLVLALRQPGEKGAGELADRDRAHRNGTRAAGLGLLAGGVVSLGGLDPAVPAQWMALAVVAAAGLASRGPYTRDPYMRAPYRGDIYTGNGSDRRTVPIRAAILPVSRAVSLASTLAAVGVLVVGAIVLPLHRAHFRASAGDWRGAHALDPDFPLYGWRLALDETEESAEKVSTRALDAARSARGLAPLWSTAGERLLAAEAGGSMDEAERALVRACDLSPFGAVAPFRLATARPADAAAWKNLSNVDGRIAEWAARALLASPWLLAATDWRGREPVRWQAVVLLVDHPGLDPAWRGALADAAGQLDGWDRARLGSEGVRQLGSRLDAEGASSFSLHAFRRPPSPAVASRIDLWAAALPLLAELPPAVELESTSTGIFAPGCRLGH